MKRVVRAAGLALAGVTAAVGVAAPAQARPAGWNGHCTLSLHTASAWGWCDGTGPQTYTIWVYCTDGRWSPSYNHPWFGDRRGAWAFCYSGTAIAVSAP